MTSTAHLSKITSIYDNRAPTYDAEGGFHARQAADFIRWMNLTPGLKVLDLACGTGPITIPAAQLVGPSGRAVGVDISGESLSIARSKAASGSLNAVFIQHDIAALHEIKEIQEGEFDIITCASAFVLLEDPGEVIKSWTKFLKVGGRLIFDVPTYNAMIGGWVMNIVGQKLGVPNAYNRNNLDALEKVKPLLVNAGLDDSETFVTESYEGSNIDVKTAGDLFNRIVKKKEWYGDINAALKKTLNGDIFTSEVQKMYHESGLSMDDSRLPWYIAKRLFVNEMEKLAGKDGIVREDMRFTMAFGKRVI